MIKWASEQVDTQAKTLSDNLGISMKIVAFYLRFKGHPIPVVIDWDKLKTAIPASPEESHNIIVWLAKHALNIVSDTEGGLGELIKVHQIHIKKTKCAGPFRQTDSRRFSSQTRNSLRT